MEEHADIRIPKPAIYAVVGLMVLATLFAAISRPAADPVSADAVVRSLTFTADKDSTLIVLDATTGQELRRFRPGEAGFVRGAVRALERERKLRDQASSAPYTLLAEPSGRLLLTDPATGIRVDLAAFGSGNMAIFRQLLPPAQ